MLPGIMAPSPVRLQTFIMGEKDSKPTEALAVPQEPRQHGTADEVVLTKDGVKMFPQPIAGDSLDPLNWTTARKHAILAIVMSLYACP